MSLWSSLYIGASGLASNSLELSVVGDNVANANTIGFKGSRAAFTDVLGQSLIGGAGQLGLGARLQNVQKMMGQGAITATGNATDLALQGSGFLVLRDAQGGQAYTRAGQMTVDSEGYLVSLEGLRLQGYAADATGNVGGVLGDMMVADATAPPNATTAITLRANLNAQSPIPTAGFDINNLDDPDNFPTTMTVYDSLGAAHVVEVYFRKVADGQWEWNAVTDGANDASGTPGTPVPLGTGTVNFDGDGNLVSGGPIALTLNPPGGAITGQLVNIDIDGLTQTASTSAVSFLSQDGYAAGTLADVRIEADGSVVGAFTNGQTRVLAQVAVADFPASDQLERVGGNLYRATNAAGEVVVGAPGTGGRASLVSGALEQSNVDLAGELVRMIIAQRSFQASSKTVTTADTLLQELIQLKR